MTLDLKSRGLSNEFVDDLSFAFFDNLLTEPLTVLDWTDGIIVGIVTVKGDPIMGPFEALFFLSDCLKSGKFLQSLNEESVEDEKVR